MTQENKELLLKDLCARLSYGVKVSKVIDDYISNPLPIRSINLDNIIVVDGYYENGVPDIDVWSYEDIKLYLFPLSSMTEEQLFELRKIFWFEIEFSNGFIELSTFHRNKLGYLEMDAMFEWFNKNHFDYRGLIKKGLALDATGLNIY